MPDYSTQSLARLVQPDRVHRNLYTDPAIFALEMERIFERIWIYVGHESQVRNPGDFFATRIGTKPVVMSRHSDGRVYVVHNQCAHRGVQVVAEDSGNAQEFRCCYHGWSYHTDGRIKNIPLRHAYGARVDVNDPKLAMVQVPRVQSYRGFVFASLAPTGPSLEDFLGHIATSLDDMVDRAPDGEIEIAGGVFKHGYDGNWKLYLENLLDAAHPLFVHQSSIEAAKVQDDAVASDGSGEIAIRQMRQNGASYGFWVIMFPARTRIRTASPLRAAPSHASASFPTENGSSSARRTTSSRKGSSMGCFWNSRSFLLQLRIASPSSTRRSSSSVQNPPATGSGSGSGGAAGGGG